MGLLTYLAQISIFVNPEDIINALTVFRNEIIVMKKKKKTWMYILWVFQLFKSHIRVSIDFKTVI